MVLQGAEAHSSRRLPAVRQVGLRAVMPQEPAVPRLRVSTRTMKMGPPIRKVWRDWTTQVQVVTPVPELKICSCSLRSRAALQEAEGTRRV